MAEKINIAEFDVDIEQLTAAAADTAKAIQTIKNEQKDLQKEGKNTDDAFIRNSVNLRGLQKDYNAQLRVLDQYMNATNKQVSIQQRIDMALSREVRTVEELRKQNQEFIKIRNQVNIETEEGQKQIALLNSQIDANTAAIKENVSGMEQQKMGIGGYTDAIKEAIGSTDIFNGALGNMEQVLQSGNKILNSIKGELSEVTDAFKNVTAGTEGMTVAQKASAVATNVTSASLKLLRVALISTGIGAIVVLLGSLVAYLTSSEQASNRFSKILKTVSGMVREVIRYLEPLGELLFDGIEAGFKAVGVIAERVFKLISAGLKTLGFENASKNVDGFVDSMQKAGQMAQMLADREAKYTEAQRNANAVMLQYQRDAERLRQVRDNENLSMNERIAANEKLGGVLKEQLATEKAIAIQALEIANLRIAQDGRTTAALDAQAEAMERVLDIQERITGQESEQLTNRVSLQKEAADRAKEAAEAEKARRQANIDQMNKELDLYIAQQDVKARSLEEDFQLELDYATRRRAIIDQEYKDRLISQTEYNTSVQELENDLALKRAELAQDNLERELSQFESRLELESKLSEAVGAVRIKQEQERAKELKDARVKYLNDLFNEELISEQEFRDSLLEVENEFLISQNELRKEFENQVREDKLAREELDFETQIAYLNERNATIAEIQKAELERQQELDLEAARKKYTDANMLAQAELNIRKEFDRASRELEKSTADAKWAINADLAGSLAQLFGEETLIGKAAAIAQATINTYLAATAALASGSKLSPIAGILAASAAIATGLASVAKISGIGVPSTSIKANRSETTTSEPANTTLNSIPPFARGGKVTNGIRIRRSNGDNVLATLKLGEVVLNRQQQTALGGDSTFRALGVPGFATGGLVSGSTNASVQGMFMGGMDKALAKTIGNAVMVGARVGTEQGSRQGIVDASTEQYLQNLSTF